ncbi:MAG: class I SAM-dependent methyltransferase [Candidatus Coatesbacteria bacterium]|nr:class I SAM-dependent methyltransferase [Candidatus Coatesbacteria bacterium]
MEKEQFEAFDEFEDNHWWFKARRKIITDIIDEITERNPEVFIFEIGMGTGGTLRDLSRFYKVAGSDISPDAVEKAKKRVPEAKIILGRAPDDIVEFIERTDVLLLLDVLEHVEKDKEWFDSIFTKLKQNAYLILTVPARRDLWSPHDVSNKHYRRYEKKEFRDLFSNLDIEVLLFSFFNTKLYPLIKLIRIITNMKGSSSGHGGMDLFMPPAFLNNLFYNIFKSEKKTLFEAMLNAQKPYSNGTSLIAVIKKK